MFDFHNLLSKIPFSTTGIPNEKHLLMFDDNGKLRTGSFAGPQTRLDLRLKEDRSWHDWSKPINQIDYFCYLHDLEYYDSEKNGKNDQDILNLKHESDRKLIERLNNFQPSDIKQKFLKFLIEKIISMKVTFGLGLKSSTSLEKMKKNCR